jgi:soluble lytic murein transglycosylase-like protein
LPTIIDQLVIELGIDPKGLEEGQRRTVRILHEITTQANRTGKSLEDNFGKSIKGVTDVLDNMHRPLGLLRGLLEGLVFTSAATGRQLGQVGQQGQQAGQQISQGSQQASEQLSKLTAESRRSGEAITAVAAEGALGFRGMAAAALIALVAVTAVSKAFEALHNISQKTMQTGVAAARAGMTPERLSQVSQAFRVQGYGANEAEIQGWAAGIVQEQQQTLQFGTPGPRTAALGILGINPFDTPDEMYRKLAARFSGMTTQQATAAAAGIGMSPEMALSLRRLGTNYEAGVGAQAGTALTTEQVEAARQFNAALAQLEIHLAALGRTLLVDVNPLLIPVIDFFTMLGDKLGALLRFVGLGSKTPASTGATGNASEDLVQSILRHEGSSDTSISPAGAIGRFQIMPGTGTPYLQPREDLHDPAVNERVGRSIIGHLWEKYHDAKAVMIAYNAGEGAADRWIAGGKNDAMLPGETQHYVSPGYAGGVPTITTAGGGADVGGPSSAWMPDWLNSMTGGAPRGTVANSNVPRMLNAARGGSYTPGDKVSNNTSANFGDIHVYTQATDGTGVASALRQAIARNMLVSQANTGLA